MYNYLSDKLANKYTHDNTCKHHVVVCCLQIGLATRHTEALAGAL